jgi:CheY-like chemotaxis protein
MRASVLLVDDSRFVRASLARDLGRRFHVQQAESGERAWELLLLDASIAAVLSDLTMPGLDGFELLRRVRGSMLPRLRDLPFAVLSGGDDVTQRERARALGADRFVVKGVGVDALGDWLAAHIGAPDAPPAAASAAGTGPIASTASVSPAEAALPTATIGDRPGPRLTSPDAVEPHVVLPDTLVAAGATTDATDGAPAEATVEAAVEAAAAWTSADAPGLASEPHFAGMQVTRLVADPLQRWFVATIDRIQATGDASPVLIRLHAAGLDDLPARLQRGVRAADALHLDGADTAWLCVPAPAPLALRLALRFALLAAGRPTPGQPLRCPIEVCLQAVDPARVQDALTALQACAPAKPAAAGVSLRCGAGVWGPAWACAVPWAAARLLMS